MPAPRLLLTAFDPYDAPENASLVLLESLVAEPPPEAATAWDRVRTARFPVDTEGIAAALDAELARHRPELVLFLGQAPGRNRICFEMLGRNLRKFSAPDNLGRKIEAAPVVAGAPETLAGTLPGAAAIVAALNAAEIPATLSEDAGTYLCNQLLYLGLERQTRDPGVRGVVFIHLPLLPRQVIRDRPEAPFMPLAMTRRALGLTLAELLGAA